MELAEAYITIRGKMDKLNADIAQTKRHVEQKFAQMEKQIKPFEKGIRMLSIAMIGMGTAATAAITGLIVQTTRLGDAMDKMAKRTGLSTEVLSQLGYAAKISGTDINTMEASLKFLSRAMDDVSQGIGESRVTFEKLGIQVTNTDGTLRSVVDILLEAGDSINGLTSETEKVAAATDLFGRRGGALLPMLREGSVGMKELMQQADELGLTISGKSAAAAAEFNDRLTDLRSSIEAAAYKLGGLLLPTIQKITITITGLVSKLSEWTEKHSFLTSAFLHLAAVVGPMLIAGGMFGLLLTQLGSITQAVKLLGATFTWFAAHPAVAIAGAITILIGALVSYGKHARDANDVTKQLAKSQEDLMRMSKKELEVLLERGREKLRSLDKELEKQRMMQTYWEDTITRAEKSGKAAKYEKDSLLEVGKELRKLADEYDTVLTGIVNLGHALDALGVSSDTSTAKISAQAKALKELKDSLPKKEDMPAFLEAEPPIPDIEKLRQFVKGADVVAETSRSLREELAKYQQRIKMGEPDIPLKRIEEMEATFAQMRARDLEEQKAMADRGEQIRDQSLQDQQDNEAAFWALMDAWRQADLAKIVAYNEATEDAEHSRQDKLAKAYEQGLEDRRKAIDWFYQYEIERSEEANEELQEGWEDLVRETEAFGSGMEMAFERSATSMENSLARFFESFYYGIEEGKSAWEMFTQFLKEALVRAVTVEMAKGIIKLGSLLFLGEGGITPGTLQPITTAGSYASYQYGGISRQPTLALVSEGSKPEAHVPLQGGKIPVDIRGGAGATIHMTNIIQFPNADPSNLDQATFERRFKRHIVQTMRNLARDGTLNKVVIS